MVQVAQLIKTMLEARQVAEAAEQGYAFTEEAGSRATELALWGTRTVSVRHLPVT